jgi:hypothetical protein
MDMDFYNRVFGQYETKSTFATLVRSVIQRVMPATTLDKLFNDNAQKQYQRTLLFSTVMELMSNVVLGTHPSLHNAYVDMKDDIPVALKSVYNKLNNTEPELAAKIVQYSAERLSPIQEYLLKDKVQATFPGYNVRIIDGNHFSGTEHRLSETRTVAASPLPGFALAILDPDIHMITNIIPCEDGHAQERSLFNYITEKVQIGEIWVADRNFATLDLMFGIASKGAFFVMRQHGSLKYWEEVSKEKRVGKTDTGTVYEQTIKITSPSTKKTLVIRRMRLELFEPTSDGETEILLLMNLPKKDMIVQVVTTDATDTEEASTKVVYTKVEGKFVNIKEMNEDAIETQTFYAKGVSAVQGCELYRGRWGIEGAFGEMTACLSCEIKTLAYPKAALFAFALAAMVYNAVAVVKGAITSVHGVEATEMLSWYYVYTEVTRAWTGMEIQLPFEYWSQRFDKMTPKQYATYLKSVAKRIDVNKYQKNIRGPKKKVKKKKDPKVNHVSTYRILQART